MRAAATWPQALVILSRNSAAVFAQLKRKASSRTAARSSFNASRAALAKSSLRIPLTPWVTTLQWTRDWICGNWHTRGHGLEHHQAKCVRATWKDEHVRGCVVRGKILTRLGACENGVRIPRPQSLEIGSRSDDCLHAGQIRRQEGIQVLLFGDATDIEKDGSITAVQLCRTWAVQIRVDTPLDHGNSRSKPRWRSSARSEEVATIVPAPEL